MQTSFSSQCCESDDYGENSKTNSGRHLPTLFKTMSIFTAIVLHAMKQNKLRLICYSIDATSLGRITGSVNDYNSEIKQDKN
jgi:hypothetical protein